MSNHFSAANLKHPGDDARLDLTDLFVFAAPDNPDRTVLIMDSNPFTKGNGFHPDAVYRFNIDTDGDALADAAFSFTFSEYDNGRQTATAYYATGSEAQTREPRGDMLIEATPVGFDANATPVQAGPVRLFIGNRSDPFFADADGVLHWLIDGQKGDFQWTGTDTFAGANILSIAVEAPNDMLGPGPIGAWVTISLRRDGMLVPMDRGGNPSYNPILNANDIKDEFNATDPLPQRPGPDRRRLLHPHDLHDPRADHSPTRRATRRPAGPLPLPRSAQPLTAPPGLSPRRRHRRRRGPPRAGRAARQLAQADQKRRRHASSPGAAAAAGAQAAASTQDGII